MKINEYLEANNLTAEEVAAVLSERLDRNIGAAAVSARASKEMPKMWANALGIEFEAPDIKKQAEEEGAKPKPKRAEDGKPKPAPDLNLVLVEERVAAIYAMVGKGVARAANEPRYEKAFYDHAPGCAKAWANLAKHDKHVATVLEALTAGGPWGEVLWIHLSLGFSLVVISGKVEIGGIFHPPAAATQNGAAAGERAESPPDFVDGTASETRE